MNKIKLISKLGKIHIMVSLQRYMTYRLNFFIRLLDVFLNLLGSVGGILIIFSSVTSVNGWGMYETLLVTGFFMLINGIKKFCIGPSLESISGLGGDIWTGKFDYTLLKPIPSQIYISINKWDPFAIVDILISIIILVCIIIKMCKIITIITIAKFAISIFISFILLYSILLLLASFAFWYLGTPLMWIFDSVINMGKYPVSIYPNIFKFILTWIVPVSFIITVPAEVLLDTASWKILLVGLIFSFIVYTVTIVFYKKSINKYSSASS